MEVPVLIGYTICRYFWSEKIGLMALTALFLVLMEIEYVRLEVKFRLPKPFDILRSREKDNVTSSIFFVSATIMTFAVFDFGIALLALFLTVFGDLASALIGIKFGKHKIFKSKTLEGFIAGLVMNLAVGFIVMPESPLIYIAMAFTASTVELLTGKLDDNLTVPIISSVVGQILVYTMGQNLTAFPGALTGLMHFIERVLLMFH
jgi:dolichol kinase